MAKNKTLSNCSCFTVTDWSKAGTDELVFHSCGAETRGTFAPGHDAKLKGVLQRLHRAGLDYSRQMGGSVQTLEPMAVAAEFGWEHFLRTEPKRGVKVPGQKAEKAPKATKTRPVEDLPLHEPVAPVAQLEGPTQVKVGRWWYDVVRNTPLVGGGFEVEYTRKGHEASAYTTVKAVEVAERLK